MASDQELLHEAEWRLCAADPLYFLEKYMMITNPRQGRHIIKLRDSQRAVGRAIQMYDRTAALKARQIGYTTICLGMAFHDAFFVADHPWLIVSVNENASKKTLARLKVIYSSLPAWMKERGPSLEAYSTESISFDNGSRVDALPTTASTGRSDAVWGVIFDEAAHMQDAEAAFGALDPLCYGPMIVISTANGMGDWFHGIWLDSQMDDSEWFPLFFPWDAVPERDATWYNSTKQKYRGSPWLFYQEYPATPEEAFARSGRPAIGDDLLADQDWCPPLWRYTYVPGTDVWELHESAEDSDICLYVWEEPTVEKDEKGRTLRLPNYVLMCDTAEGLAHGDYTAITVWNANTYEVVATMRTHYPIDDLGELIESLGYRYHTALIMVERNNHGMVPLTYLHKYARYPRLYRMPKLARQVREEARRLDYGWLTTARTKPKMVYDFIKGLRDGNIVLHDQRFRIEASTFVADGRGGYAATHKHHDDLMIAHLGGYQGVQDVGNYPPIYFDDAPRMITFGEFMNLTSQQPEERHPLDGPPTADRGALDAVPWNPVLDGYFNQ